MGFPSIFIIGKDAAPRDDMRLVSVGFFREIGDDFELIVKGSTLYQAVLGQPSKVSHRAKALKKMKKYLKINFKI